jgi:hypothetical protein
MYLCRTLSYKGAEFEIVEATLDDKMMVWPTNFFEHIDGYSFLYSEVVIMLRC